jgi:hypothetical protein
MAKKKNDKKEERRFRGFGHCVELAEKLDLEAIKRQAEARRRSVERMVQEAFKDCEEQA